MTDERITVYSRHYSVPGVILETELGAVLIAYVPPGERSRADWFYALATRGKHGKHAGQRMGETDDPPVRYSVAPAIPDEAA